MTVSTLLPWLVLFLLYHPENWLKNADAGKAGAVIRALAFFLETFWCCQIVALKSLRDESMKVAKELNRKDLDGARQAVSMIVGRDTEKLTETGVAKAAVETVAENCSDGIIAPLFYMMLFGAVGGFFYKSVNTMDSMIGYRNDRYRYFGTFAARLDDVLNFIPARFAGILMTLAAGICGYDRKNALKIFLRDRKKHDSPNSAHTEAATAGALDIQLAGDAWYFGKLHKKQYLGDPIHPVETDDIARANKLAFATSVLALCFLWALRLVLVLLTA